jgi:hypothetical protein
MWRQRAHSHHHHHHHRRCRRRNMYRVHSDDARVCNNRLFIIVAAKSYNIQLPDDRGRRWFYRTRVRTPSRTWPRGVTFLFFAQRFGAEGLSRLVLYEKRKVVYGGRGRLGCSVPANFEETRSRNLRVIHYENARTTLRVRITKHQTFDRLSNRTIARLTSLNKSCVQSRTLFDRSSREFSLTHSVCVSRTVYEYKRTLRVPNRWTVLTQPNLISVHGAPCKRV